MKVYQIDYDLRKQKNYEAIHERIRSYGTYCNPLKSSWLIATNQTAEQFVIICDLLWITMMAC